MLLLLVLLLLRTRASSLLPGLVPVVPAVFASHLNSRSRSFTSCSVAASPKMAMQI